MILREYQLKVLNDFLSTKDDVLYCLPTGTGKSVLILEIIKLCLKRGLKVGVVVPSIELVSNLYKYFIENGLINYIQLIGSKKITSNKYIYLGVYKSFKNKIDLLPKLDIMIHDECHHVACTTWDTLMKLGRNIGFSATPLRLDGKPLLFNRIYEPELISWYMEKGYLCDNITEYVGDQLIISNSTKPDDLLEQWQQIKAKMHGDCVRDWLQYGENKQTVIYATTVQHCQELLMLYHKVTTVGIIHSQQTYKTRNEVLNAFVEERIKVLINVNVLTEGVNVPNISCIQFCRYFGNLAGYVQSVGRALRPGKNKSVIIIDNAGNLSHGSVKNLNGWSELFYEALKNPIIEEQIQQLDELKIKIPSINLDPERGSNNLVKYSLTKFDEYLLKSVRYKSGKKMLEYWEAYLQKNKVTPLQYVSIIKVCQAVMSSEKADRVLKHYLG